MLSCRPISRRSWGVHCRNSVGTGRQAKVSLAARCFVSPIRDVYGASGNYLFFGVRPGSPVLGDHTVRRGTHGPERSLGPSTASGWKVFIVSPQYYNFRQGAPYSLDWRWGKSHSTPIPSMKSFIARLKKIFRLSWVRPHSRVRLEYSESNFEVSSLPFVTAHHGCRRTRPDDREEVPTSPARTLTGCSTSFNLFCVNLFC